MAFCKVCGDVFQWGFCDGQWVPLEPSKTHDDLDKTYVDEFGDLRADHRDRHSGGASVNVTRLEQKVPASELAPEPEPVEKGMAVGKEPGWFARRRARRRGQTMPEPS